MVRSSFVAPETAASRHERAVNFRKLSKISFARPIECEFWKVLSRARPPPQKVWDTLEKGEIFSEFSEPGQNVVLYETRFRSEKAISRWGRNETQTHELWAESCWKGMHLSHRRGHAQHPSRISHSFPLCTATVTGRRRRCKYAPSVHHLIQPVLILEHLYAFEPLFSFAGHF